MIFFRHNFKNRSLFSTHNIEIRIGNIKPLYFAPFNAIFPSSQDFFCLLKMTRNIHQVHSVSIHWLNWRIRIEYLSEIKWNLLIDFVQSAILLALHLMKQKWGNNVNEMCQWSKMHTIVIADGRAIFRTPKTM